MRSKSLRKLAYDSLYRPGIDLAVLIAVGSAILDSASLLFPWLVGVNSSYTSGKGLTYTVSAYLSGLDLIGDLPFIIILFVPIILTVALVFFSLRPEGLVLPRMSYKTKSRVILVLAALLSIAPPFFFLNQFGLGMTITRPGVFVGHWEMGSGATMPTYAGLGFALALGFKMIKD
jgi:hypothetical protein